MEALRSRGEYAVEILTLRMTWQRYLSAYQGILIIILELMIKLYQLCAENQKLKPYIIDYAAGLAGLSFGLSCQGILGNGSPIIVFFIPTNLSFKKQPDHLYRIKYVE